MCLYCRCGFGTFWEEIHKGGKGGLLFSFHRFFFVVYRVIIIIILNFFFNRTNGAWGLGPGTRSLKKKYTFFRLVNGDQK